VWRSFSEGAASSFHSADAGAAIPPPNGARPRGGEEGWGQQTIRVGGKHHIPFTDTFPATLYVNAAPPRLKTSRPTTPLAQQTTKRRGKNHARSQH